MESKKVIVIPGSFSLVSAYGGYNGIDIWLKKKLDKDKIIPLSSWFYASIKVLKLLRINVLENLRKLPKENVVIIRGTKDYYFCDSENADLIKSEGFILFEVDAKHNWNQNIAEMVNKIIYGMLIR